MSIEFELVPEKVPVAVKYGSRYDDILDAFNRSDSKSVRVATKSVGAKKLAMGLRTRIRSRGITDIKICLRKDSVYLEKKKK